MTLRNLLSREHRYAVTVRWTGNAGSGTSNYRDYKRKHVISVEGRASIIPGSSERVFRGDSTRWNPEELLVASISACHELWYLHLCALAGVVVLDYVDHAEGMMEESEDGSGRFKKVILKPEVTITQGSDSKKAFELHKEAHAKCFIANSVSFEVDHLPRIEMEHVGLAAK